SSCRCNEYFVDFGCDHFGLVFTNSLTIESGCFLSDAGQVQGNCTEKLDIAFLADTSLSMQKKQRTTLYELASKLIDNYPVSDGGNHYGFITFDRKVKIHNNFATRMYYNKQAAFKQLIKEKAHLVPGRNQWGTRSDIALHKAATELFTTDGGDRPDAKNVLLVFTDGKQFMLKKDQRISPFQNFSESTKKLEDEDVSITVVGILGKNWKAEENKLKMKEMAGNKGQVLMYQDFSALTKHFDNVLAALCLPYKATPHWKGQKLNFQKKYFGLRKPIIFRKKKN
ncbi:unnamed protein product, partial [Porites lobata]